MTPLATAADLHTAAARKPGVDQGERPSAHAAPPRSGSTLTARSRSALLSILYLVAVFVLSYLKLLWLDELITLHIARLGSVSAIWRALAAGADPNPPLIHILVMFCRRIFGEWEFGLRLPAVVGYWVGMASLFAFLRRRVPAVWALSAAALSMAMGSFEWAYESRSYGVFYGTTMLALYCWSLAADPRSA